MLTSIQLATTAPFILVFRAKKRLVLLDLFQIRLCQFASIRILLLEDGAFPLTLTDPVEGHGGACIYDRAMLTLLDGSLQEVMGQVFQGSNLPILVPVLCKLGQVPDFVLLLLCPAFELQCLEVMVQ